MTITEETAVLDKQQSNKQEESTTVSDDKTAPEEDVEKINIKFVFANRDGVNVVFSFEPSYTVGEVKGMLLSMWPDGEF